MCGRDWSSDVCSSDLLPGRRGAFRNGGSTVVPVLSFCFIAWDLRTASVYEGGWDLGESLAAWIDSWLGGGNSSGTNGDSTRFSALQTVRAVEGSVTETIMLSIRRCSRNQVHGHCQWQQIVYILTTAAAVTTTQTPVLQHQPKVYREEGTVTICATTAHMIMSCVYVRANWKKVTWRWLMVNIWCVTIAIILSYPGYFYVDIRQITKLSQDHSTHES